MTTDELCELAEKWEQVVGGYYGTDSDTARQLRQQSRETIKAARIALAERRAALRKEINP